jgi:NADH-quinone oxidoreductase subunit M
MDLNNIPILSILIFLPLVGAFFISLIDESVAVANARQVALWTGTVTLALALILLLMFDASVSGYQFLDNLRLFSHIGLEYKVGVDGISLAFILMTTLLFPLSVLAGWDRMKIRLKSYMILFLILETLVLGAFCQLNLLMFFVFFESCLIPLYFLMGLWGGEINNKISSKFFIYFLLSFCCELLVLMEIFSAVGSFDLEKTSAFSFDPSLEPWMFLGLFLSFAIKIPLIPFHIWFPQTEGQFPTPISMIFGGVFLKIAPYGIIKILLPLFPTTARLVGPFLCGFCGFGIIYTSWVAFGQKNLKKVVAYGSLSETCFILLGLFSFQVEALKGAIFHSLSQSFIAAGLFFSVGLLHQRMQTYSIEDYGGLSKVMPQFSLIFFLLLLANMGFPGTSSFIGHIFIMMGFDFSHLFLTILIGVGIFFSGIYTLWLYQRTATGNVTSTLVWGLEDLNSKEKGILGVCLSIIFLMGIFPSPVMKMAEKVLPSILAPHKLPLEKQMSPQND